MLFAIVGMMVMASASNLMTLYLGLELQSLALYVLAAFARDDVRSSEAGLKYFVLSRPRLRPAAVRHLAGLRLLRHDGFRRLCARCWRSPSHALGRADRRHRVHPGRPRLQDLRRAVPHVDARRLRGRADPGDGVLRHRAEGRGDGAAAARDGDAVRPPAWRMAAADHPGVDRLDDPRRAGGDRADQHQAADGVFLDRPYGLRADRPRGRHAGGHPRRAGLHGGLRVHDRRHLRLHHRDAPQRPRGGANQRPVGPGNDRSGAGAGAGDVHVQPGRHPADVGVLRQAVHLPRRRAGRPVDARRHRRADQRGGRVLLHPHRSR